MRQIDERAGEYESQQAACAGEHTRAPPERGDSEDCAGGYDDRELARFEGDESRG
jgi:hypothetical protein